MKAEKNTKSTKISIILTPENFKKMEEVTKHTGMTRTEYINNACDKCVVIGIAETANVAEEFAKLRAALENAYSHEEVRKVGDAVCQSFALLMEKMTKFHDCHKR